MTNKTITILKHNFGKIILALAIVSFFVYLFMLGSLVTKVVSVNSTQGLIKKTETTIANSESDYLNRNKFQNEEEWLKIGFQKADPVFVDTKVTFVARSN